MSSIYEPKNVLITGGCGFIFSNFINYMVRKYPSINFVNVDCLYHCSSLNNITVDDCDNYTFVCANVNQREKLLDLMREHDIDTVVHSAAQSSVDNSYESTRQFIDDNILGTYNVLEACCQHGKIKRFLHISTDEVYGESSHGEEAKTEESSLYPTNPYSATKASAEMIAFSYYKSYKVPVLITRCNNVYGERQFPEKLIPKFIYLLTRNRKCPIHGNGSNLRSFLYVEDAIRALDIVLTMGNIGEVYNIAASEELSVMEVAGKLIKELKPGDNVDDWITHVEDRKWNDKRYHVSSAKLEKLGWAPNIDFDSGLKQTIDWYLAIDFHSHWPQLKKNPNLAKLISLDIPC